MNNLFQFWAVSVHTMPKYRHSLSLRLQLSGKQSMRRSQMSDEYHCAICSFSSGGNIIQNKTLGGVNVGCIGTHSHFGPLTRGQ